MSERTDTERVEEVEKACKAKRCDYWLKDGAHFSDCPKSNIRDQVMNGEQMDCPSGLKLCNSPCYDFGGDSEKPLHCEDHYLWYPHHADGTQCACQAINAAMDREAQDERTD